MKPNVNIFLELTSIFFSSSIDEENLSKIRRVLTTISAILISFACHGIIFAIIGITTKRKCDSDKKVSSET